MPTPANHPHNEWDMPPDGTATDTLARAAKLVWIIGAIEIAIFGCFSTALAMGAILPTSQFEQLVEQGQMTRDQFNEFLAMQPVLGPAAIALFVLGFVPGLMYLVAGFAVRRGNTVACTATMVLAATQFIVFGLIFALNALGAILTHNPVGLTVNVVTLGSLLLMLGLAVRWLLLARQQRRHPDPQPYTDPWKHPHP